MSQSPVFIGIDVSKNRLDVAVRPTAETFTSPNDDSGIDALVERITALKPKLIVLEAAFLGKGRVRYMWITFAKP